MDGFSYWIFSGKGPGSNAVEAELYNKTYEFWKRQWSKTFAEIQINKEIFSDDFVRQSHVTALFYYNTPVGCFFLDDLDIHNSPHRDLTSLKYFNASELDFVAGHHGSHIMTWCYLTVDPKFRKSHMSLQFSDLLLTLATKKFLETKGDAVMCYTRDDRRVNDVVQRHGGRKIDDSLVVNGIPSTKFYIERDRIKPSELVPLSFAEKLWTEKNSRFDLTNNETNSTKERHEHEHNI